MRWLTFGLPILALLVSDRILAQDVSLPPAFDPYSPAAAGFTLTFNATFGGSTLSRKEWRTATPWGAFYPASNNQQYYIDIQDPNNPVPINPFVLDHEVLTIFAAPFPVIPPLVQRPTSYISGIITTYGLFSQEYGYFEAELKTPSGSGLWPTFWLLPESLTWPPELDVMEMSGSEPTQLQLTEHDNVAGQDQHNGCIVTVPDMSAGFHIYGLLWTPNYLSWYFDRRRICYTVTRSSQHEPMYLLLNLAVSNGDFGGTPQATTPFPQTLQVGFVRAWSLPQSWLNN